MKVRLYDQNLGDPATFSLIVVAKKIDTLIREKFGSWSGFNGFLLGLIGKHPSTDPKKIAVSRDYIVNRTPLGTTWKNRKNLTMPQIQALANKLIAEVKAAKSRADAGDWVAARHFTVFAEMLQILRNDIGFSIEAKGSTNPTILDPDTTPPPTMPGMPQIPTDIKKLIVPAAIIFGIKLLLF